MTTAVSFQNISRYFGPVRAVDDVTLDISEGEFFAMLGPSGFRQNHLPPAYRGLRAANFRPHGNLRRHLGRCSALSA